MRCLSTSRLISTTSSSWRRKRGASFSSMADILACSMPSAFAWAWAATDGRSVPSTSLTVAGYGRTSIEFGQQKKDMNHQSLPTSPSSHPHSLPRPLYIQPWMPFLLICRVDRSDMHPDRNLLTSKTFFRTQSQATAAAAAAAAAGEGQASPCCKHMCCSRAQSPRFEQGGMTLLTVSLPTRDKLGAVSLAEARGAPFAARW
jgi:hypothetical protein